LFDSRRKGNASNNAIGSLLACTTGKDGTPDRRTPTHRPERQCLRIAHLHHEGDPRCHPSTLLQAVDSPLHGVRRARLLLHLRPHLRRHDLHPSPSQPIPPIPRMGCVHDGARLRLHRHLDPRPRVRTWRVLEIQEAQLDDGPDHALLPARALPLMASLALSTPQGHRQHRQGYCVRPSYPRILAPTQLRLQGPVKYGGVCRTRRG
jgi:hypothetical protein